MVVVVTVLYMVRVYVYVYIYRAKRGRRKLDYGGESMAVRELGITVYVLLLVANLSVEQTNLLLLLLFCGFCFSNR